MVDLHIIAIDSTSALMPAVFALRHDVFVREQAVPPEIERDEFDDTATHLIAVRDDAVIGTLRIVMSGRTAKIGRMAVHAAARTRGIGTRLMQRAAEVAHAMGATEVALHAQLSVREFYGGLGYREEGGIFEEAGIMHIAMRKTLV
jgi:predicted GNAT family N-acyltransferase